MNFDANPTEPGCRNLPCGKSSSWVNNPLIKQFQSCIHPITHSLIIPSDRSYYRQTSNCKCFVVIFPAEQAKLSCLLHESQESDICLSVSQRKAKGNAWVALNFPKRYIKCIAVREQALADYSDFSYIYSYVGLEWIIKLCSDGWENLFPSYAIAVCPCNYSED